MKKKTTLEKYAGLEYVIVRDVPVIETKYGDSIHADVLKKIDERLSREILGRRVPLRGKEVRFLRKAAGISLRAFAELLGLTHPAVKKWEDAPDERLSFVNALAVRAVLTKHWQLDAMIADAVTAALADKAPKIEIGPGRAA